MAEAAEYVEELGLDAIERQADTQGTYLREELRRIAKVVIHSPEQSDVRISVVAFGIDGMTGRRIADALREKWNIITRSTDLRFDGVRVSVAFFTTTFELDIVIQAVARLCELTQRVPGS